MVAGAHFSRRTRTVWCHVHFQYTESPTTATINLRCRAILRAPYVPIPRLNITARLAWLMVTLSRRTGYASMAPERMAAELNSTPTAIRQARQKLVQLGLFAPPTRWRYNRIALPREDRNGYYQRVRADRRLDLTARCAWLLCDVTRRQGEAAIALPAIAAYLDASERAVLRAAGRVLELGHFAVERGGGRGIRNLYARAQGGIALPMPCDQQEEMMSDEDEQIGDLDNPFWGNNPFGRAVAGEPFLPVVADQVSDDEILPTREALRRALDNVMSEGALAELVGLFGKSFK